ncbi:MAG: GH3 auxin-responsive promoter family protein, partial [Chthoniobacteraceae bacterium]
MMKPIAALANGAWLASSLPAWQRFHHALDHPEKEQSAVLQRLLTKNAESAYGQAHGFANIRSYEQFRARVPLVEYEDLEPWISRIRRGQGAVLTGEPVTHLIPTSGSTAARKLIPFTAGLQRQFNAAIGPWIVDLCREHPTVPLGPAYWSISPSISASADDDSIVPIGFDADSAYLGGIRKHLVEATFAVPSSVRLVTDPNTFRYPTLLCLLRQPELRLISVWHPSFLSLLLDALAGSWEELVAEVASGECRGSPTLVARPQPERARQLREIGYGDASWLWPRLRVVSCWADAQAALACADLQRRLPGVAFQSKGLLATEAFVSIPFRGFHPIALTSHFFEFLDEADEPHLAHELRSGEIYSVVVTTAGGLWRYRLGDLVEVDGYLDATPSLRFLGRGASVS